MVMAIGVCAAVGQNVSLGGNNDMDNKKDLIIYYKILNSDGELECHVDVKVGRVYDWVTYEQAVEMFGEDELKQMVVDTYCWDITLDDVFIITKEEYDEIENTIEE